MCQYSYDSIPHLNDESKVEPQHLTTHWNVIYDPKTDRSSLTTHGILNKQVRRIYKELIDQATTTQERQELHLSALSTVEEILRWTKAHLDAYLAIAEVILEQNVNPDDLLYSWCLNLRGSGCWEVYDSTIVYKSTSITILFTL